MFCFSNSAFPINYDDVYKAHVEDFYKALLIHLDDPSTKIQVMKIVLLLIMQLY